MIHDTLQKIELRLAASETLSDENRAALETLLKDLRTEIDTLSGDRVEEAESIAAFTESSAREALRTKQDPDLLEASIQGLQRSVRHFEASHPDLTQVVNGICQQLSNLGI
jgi:hypothetical protein